MVERISSATKLRSILNEMEKSPFLKKICDKQKHVAGNWDFDHLKSQLCQMILTFKNDAAIFVYFEKNEPVSIFAGLVSADWTCGKRGLNEVIWISVKPTLRGGFKVIQAAENFVAENDIDYFSCSYMCNGGDPRIQVFYLTNGFRLDTLSFVKSYK
jgi:hypothetical protein